MLKKMTVLLILLVASSAFAKPLNVTVSFSILEDIANNIGGERIQVTSIVKANQNSHTYEPKPSDIIGLNKADLFIIIGLNFEGWMTRFMEAANFSGILVNTSKDVPLLTGDASHSHDKQEIHNKDHSLRHSHNIDPHIWQSPKNVMIMAKNIQEALIKADPEHKEYYQKNFERYYDELTLLDKWAHSELATLEEPHFLIVHDSFKYLTRDYQIYFHPIMRSNAVNDISAKELALISTLVKDNHIRVAFFENIESSRFLQMIINDLHLALGGVLYTDALPTDKKQAHYLDMFRFNINQMTKAIRDAKP